MFVFENIFIGTVFYFDNLDDNLLFKLYISGDFEDFTGVKKISEG